MRTRETLIPLFDNLVALKEMPAQEMQVISELQEPAKRDFVKSKQFLIAYRGSEETFKAYRREIERLLQWSWFVRHKTLVDLRRDDLEQFIEFCQAPPKHWIGHRHVPRFINKDGVRIPNQEWRPFIATVGTSKDTTKQYVYSQSAIQATFAILSSFFNYLEQEEYTFGNPIAQIRQKSKFVRKMHGKQPVRRLSELQWAYVIETAEIMAAENPDYHERTLFMMTAFYAMYLRISELSASSRWVPQMGHFYQDIDHNWWFKTVGKGNKERDVSVSNAMLLALKRYRQFLGLSSLPPPGDNAPLLPKKKGLGPIQGTRHIRRIVQQCFDRSKERLHADGFKEDAELLDVATVHWLRHTGISEDVKSRPREHVRDDAGHSSSAITDKYIDIELRARHASARKKPLKLEEQ